MADEATCFKSEEAGINRQDRELICKGAIES